MVLDQLAECAGDIIRQLQRGAFLTVRDADGRLNVMTVGWAYVGLIWRMPMAMMLVRPERHTYMLLEDAEDFTLSFPSGNMKDELMGCGSTSGRDVNKFERFHLEAVEGRATHSPVIGGCGTYLECRITVKEDLGCAKLLTDEIDHWYEGEGKHILYHGKVVECYKG